MAEPFRMKIFTMDVSLNKTSDGNHMTTKAVPGSLTKGCDLENRDGLTSLSSSSSLSSSPSSSSPSSLLMVPSGTKKKEIKDGRETLRGEDFRKKGRNDRREGMIKETEEKENLDVVMERKKAGRPMGVVDYFLEDLSSPVLGGIIMDWASWVDTICRKLGSPVNEELLLCASTIREGTLELMTRLHEEERMKLERKALDKLREEREEKDMEEMELVRKETKRKELKMETIRKKLVTQLREAKDEISRLEGVIKGRELERKETEREELEKMEGKETIRKELVIQLREAKDEISRLEGVIKERELERKETERKELERMEGKEMIRKELVNQLREARDEISRLEGVIMERKESDRKELERKELERKEFKRKETDRKEMERKEIERKKMERRKVERKEMERKETGRKEMERRETERKEIEGKELDMKKGPVMAEGSNITSISPFLIGEVFPLLPLPQRVTRNFIARSGGDRVPLVVQSPPPMVNRGFEGGRTDGGACKGVILEDGSMSGSETEWRLVGGRRRGKDPVHPPLPSLSDSGMEPSGPNDCTEWRSLSRQHLKSRSRLPTSTAVMNSGRTEGFFVR